MISLGMLVTTDDLVPVYPNGLLSFELIAGKQVTSNLVETRVRTQLNSNSVYQPLNTIDWIELLDSLSNPNEASKYASITFTKLKNLIRDTYGVSSADVGNAELGYDKNTVFFNGLCFTHDCGEIEELNI